MNVKPSYLPIFFQDDLFIGTLTVKEHLVFQAKVRMDRHIPFKDRMERVETVMIEVTEIYWSELMIYLPPLIVIKTIELSCK